MLPESCVAEILSFTSPADTFSSSAVSSVFRSAGDSDVVWEKFLPSNYRDVISRSINRLNFSSKKQLFRCLCEPVLVDNGTKMFNIEKLSGKISYILSARDLSITWSDVPTHWSWSPRPDSRFSEAVELITTDWLEIRGKIRTRALSPNTTYGAYLIMKVTPRAYGLDLIPSEVSVKLGKNRSAHVNTAYLCCLDSKKEQMKRLWFGNREERIAAVSVSVVAAGEGELREPKDRDDGWMEIELGEFEIGEGDDEEVSMSLMEVKGFQLKGGIVIEGIEVRPKL